MRCLGQPCWLLLVYAAPVPVMLSWLLVELCCWLGLRCQMRLRPGAALQHGGRWRRLELANGSAMSLEL